MSHQQLKSTLHKRANDVFLMRKAISPSHFNSKFSTSPGKIVEHKSSIPTKKQHQAAAPSNTGIDGTLFPAILNLNLSTNLRGAQRYGRQSWK